MRGCRSGNFLHGYLIACTENRIDMSEQDRNLEELQVMCHTSTAKMLKKEGKDVWLGNALKLGRIFKTYK